MIWYVVRWLDSSVTRGGTDASHPINMVYFFFFNQKEKTTRTVLRTRRALTKKWSEESTTMAKVKEPTDQHNWFVLSDLGNGNGLDWGLPKQSWFGLFWAIWTGAYKKKKEEGKNRTCPPPVLHSALVPFLPTIQPSELPAFQSIQFIPAGQVRLRSLVVALLLLRRRCFRFRRRLRLRRGN